MAKKKNINFQNVEVVNDSDVKKELTPEERKSKVIETLTREKERLNNKDFTFYFFVMDTKGTPNGTLNYMYDTAMTLKNKGYKVAILHGNKEFVGVEGWMGEEFAKLPHYNIETDGVKMNASDFLIIPELFSNVMFKTMKLPCKRIVLLTNYNYLTEVIQPGVTWGEYNLIDCITSSTMLENKIKNVFPYLRTKVVNNKISDKFKHDGSAKKLFVNIIAKSPSDMNRVVKEFFWKYPMYKWVAFRDIRGLSQDEFADALKDSFLTVWVDEKSNFGYSPLAAMKADNLVIARVPEEKLDWANNENGELNDSCVWFYNMDDVQQLIAWAIDMFMGDTIPTEIKKDAEDAYNKYSEENFDKEIEDVYINGYVEARKAELDTALSIANKKEK